MPSSGITGREYRCRSAGFTICAAGDASGRQTRMEKIIIEVAAEQRVGHFPRFLLMKRAIEGMSGLVSWDGLHNSAEGHECVGVALAQMIDAAARQ